ncbi:unnamed protein product [Linum trigynum]|uniref:Uncharacterized protein n=1 Tax=Linum trigynum TaxID=586398 RepID=A0AAV2GQ81_9ROSI
MWVDFWTFHSASWLHLLWPLIACYYKLTPSPIPSPQFQQEVACERDCSKGEDYRLTKLTIIDYNSKKEQDVMVECRGHDAARLSNIDHAQGWGKDVAGMVEDKHGKESKVSVSFECKTEKSEESTIESQRN